MKLLKQSAVVLACLAIFSFTFVSCSKDDDGGSGGSAGSGTITAKVDGQKVTTMEITTAANIIEQSGIKILTVQGNDSGTSPGRAFYFSIWGFEDVGTYIFEGTSMAQYHEITVDPNNPTEPVTEMWMTGAGVSGDGEFKVSEVTSTNIKGTFHFVGKNADGSSKNITDGSFNVKLQ